MKIKAKHWNLYCYIAGLPGLLSIMIGMINKNEIWIDISFVYLMIIGCSGLVMALLIRFGIVQFVYSDKDRKGLLYKMQKHVADNEKRIWGNLFSDRYYKTYEDENK